jgi:hypothetical protein
MPVTRTFSSLGGEINLHYTHGDRITGTELLVQFENNGSWVFTVESLEDFVRKAIEVINEGRQANS